MCVCGKRLRACKLILCVCLGNGTGTHYRMLCVCVGKADLYPAQINSTCVYVRGVCVE